MTVCEAAPIMELEEPQGKATFVIGLQWGDEGKGKIVDLLAQEASAVIRGNGGSNAGHRIKLKHLFGREKDYVSLHQIPSGIAHPTKRNIMGHGVFLDPVRLYAEKQDLRSKDIDVSPENLAVSGMAHFVLPAHKKRDAARESGKSAQGSTKAGIAYTASDKSLREGIRAETVLTKSRDELFDIAYKSLRSYKTRRLLGVRCRETRQESKKLADEFVWSAKKLIPYIRDTIDMTRALLEDGENVVVEGAQAFGLDIDHGKYPYTTSSNTTVPGLMVGTGLNHNDVGKVVGVVKATPSKVGGGAFVGRITDEEIAANIRGKKGEVDGEFGGTTGRQREVGWLDLVALKRAIEVNGVDVIALTKFDCIKRAGETTYMVVGYDREVKHPDGSVTIERLATPPSCDEELEQCSPVLESFPTWEDDNSEEAQNYINFIEKYLKIKISMVSNGPERDQVVIR